MPRHNRLQFEEGVSRAPGRPGHLTPVRLTTITPSPTPRLQHRAWFQALPSAVVMKVVRVAKTRANERPVPAMQARQRLTCRPATSTTVTDLLHCNLRTHR